MFAKDGITQIDAVSQTFTDFFWRKGPGRLVIFLFYVYEKLTMTKIKMTMTKIITTVTKIKTDMTKIEMTITKIEKTMTKKRNDYDKN